MERVLINRTLDEIKYDIVNNRIGLINFLEKGLQEFEYVLREYREEVFHGQVLELARKNYFAILEFLKEQSFERIIGLNSRDYAYFIQQYTDRANDIFNSPSFRLREDLAKIRAESKSRIESSHRSDDSGIRIVSSNPNIRAKFEFK